MMKTSYLMRMMTWGTSTIPDLSVASEEEQEIDTLFKLSTVHPDGKSVKQWVHYQNMDSMEQFFNGMKGSWQKGSFAPLT